MPELKAMDLDWRGILVALAGICLVLALKMRLRRQSKKEAADRYALRRAAWFEARKLSE